MAVCKRQDTCGGMAKKRGFIFPKDTILVITAGF
jgi:hypothetical protein